MCGSVVRSFGRSVDRLPDARSLGSSVDRSVAWSIARSLAPTIARSIARSLGRSVDRSIGRSVARSLPLGPECVWRGAQSLFLQSKPLFFVRAARSVSLSSPPSPLRSSLLAPSPLSHLCPERSTKRPTDRPTDRTIDRSTKRSTERPVE